MSINLRLVAFFFVVYLLALAALTPLSWLRQFFEPGLQSAGVRLENLEGSLWQGRAAVRAPQVAPLQLSWQSQPLYLLSARLPYQLTVRNTDLELDGRLVLKAGGASLEQVNGYIDDPAFAEIAASYGAEVRGRLRLDDVSASAGWGGSLGELGGDLSWSGGPVTVPFGSRNQTFQVPQMQGQLSSDDSGWQARVRAMDATPLIAADLGRDGMASLSVQRALAERLDLVVPAGRDTLLEVTQQVF